MSKAPDFPDEPVLSFIAINKTIFDQDAGNPEPAPDTLIFTLGFTDGNGDLGAEGNGNDIELIDTRTGFPTMNSLPMLPIQGSGNGVEGEATVNFSIIPGLDFCCIPPFGNACEPSSSFPQDTFRYLIRIQDRAGNWSNQVSTPDIFINCN